MDVSVREKKPMFIMPKLEKSSHVVGPAVPLEAKHVTEYAIKIYKTSILVFKDRDKYVSGEHRWRKGYCKYWVERMLIREYPQCLILSIDTTDSIHRQIESS